MSLLLLNENVLKAWKNIDPESWEVLVEDILNLFLENSPAQFSSLVLASEEENFENVRLLAHKLKSSCGNIGAEQAQAILNDIEKACLDQQYNVAQGLMAQLQPLFNETMIRVEHYKNHQQWKV